MKTDDIYGHLGTLGIVIIGIILIAYNLHFNQNDANFNGNVLGIFMEILGFLFMIKSTSKKITLDKNAIKTTEVKSTDDVVIYPVTYMKTWNGGISLVIIGLILQFISIGWDPSLTLFP